MEVARLLRALCASGNEVVCCQPVWQQNDRIIAAFTLTLREALLSCYDLREPRPALREWIEKACNAPFAMLYLTWLAISTCSIRCCRSRHSLLLQVCIYRTCFCVQLRLQRVFWASS